MQTSIGGGPASAEDLTALAAEAFIYGFPLVFDLEQVDRFDREGIGDLAPSPFNAFSHAGSLAGPEATFVSINNDTLYSIANVDVSGGPVRLEVPGTHGRYYVLQFVDAWTNNFAYVGHRATGTEPGSFLLVAPDWDGAAPEGATVIRFPTRVATIVGRIAVDGESDMPNVREVQSGLSLTDTAAARGLPEIDSSVPDDLVFFERMRAWMRAFPPAERDLQYQQRFAALGLFAEESPFTDASSAVVAAARNGLKMGRERLEHALSHDSAPHENGWSLTYHAFDYNLDWFEIGTIDDDRWKLPDTPDRYLLRAAAARGGLWGNHGYEAAYAMVNTDPDGHTLEGANRYQLRFASPPPCRAFWSVTMYNTPHYFLVENPIDRYSIGDRTRGLHRAADGSLTIVMQREEPDDPEQRANWLPTPDGAFRPILRMYEPDEAVFDGGYELPPIVRTE